MNKILLTILKPIDLIESRKITFNLGFFKVILAFFLWEGNKVFVGTISILFGLENYTAQGIIYIMFIPLFIWLLSFPLGEKNDNKEIRTINLKMIIISLIAVLFFIFISAYTITPLLYMLPQNDTLKSVAEIASNSNLFYSFAICGLFAPIMEEVFFRGIILQGVSNRYNTKIGIFVSAALFGLVHMNLQQGIYTFLFGLVLGNIYNKSKSLYLVIACHFINNLIALFF